MNRPVTPVYGRIRRCSAEASVPGSKSMTVRALVMAALSDGTSRLSGANLSCGDGAVTVGCLRSLGIDVETDGDEAMVRGCGDGFPVKHAELYVGSSGLAARLLTAVLAFSDGEYRLDCAPDMARRPMRGLLEALEALGASFSYLGEDHALPFAVRGRGDLSGDTYVDTAESSQYLSALLAAAPLSGGRVRVRPSGQVSVYVRLTEEAMGSFGVSVEETEDLLSVSGRYASRDLAIGPDASSACYFHAADRILGTHIRVRGERGSSQPDAAFGDFIKDFSGGDADMSSMADQALTLAAVAPYLDRPTRITGVAHLRREECDRLGAAACNLRALGAGCEETEDGLVVYPSAMHGGVVDSFSDHRVAMSFALCGLRTDGVVVSGAEACSKSFPGFFDELDRVCAALT